MRLRPQNPKNPKDPKNRTTVYYSQWRNKEGAKGRPWLLLIFFFIKKKWMNHIGARRGGHGAMAPPLALVLFCWCGY